MSGHDPSGGDDPAERRGEESRAERLDAEGRGAASRGRERRDTVGDGAARVVIRRTGDWPEAVRVGVAAGLEESGHESDGLLGLWGAFLDGRMVGAASLRSSEGLYLIGWMAVEDRLRGGGLGRRLLEAVEGEARRLRAADLWAAARAPGFYAAAGYRRAGGDHELRVLLDACLTCSQYGRGCSPQVMRKTLGPGRDEGSPEGDLVLRAGGREGELVLRRRAGRTEVISGGTFLISSDNEASSRAMVAAAREALPAPPLDILIGGLGLGYALDEALDLPQARTVVVAEIEPVIVDWFRRFGDARAERAARDARVEIRIADVYDLLTPASYDLIALDTDNGARWLVRDGNARLYAEGLVRARASLRADGVLVVWSPGHDDALAADLQRLFASVAAVEAEDVVDGRQLLYVMYTALAVRRAAIE